eukprot:3412185-Pyramimonas_sp.AAC.1
MACGTRAFSAANPANSSARALPMTRERIPFPSSISAGPICDLVHSTTTSQNSRVRMSSPIFCHRSASSPAG